MLGLAGAGRNLGRGRPLGVGTGGGGAGRSDILFHSPWDTATGVTFGPTGAVTDGGAWNQEYTCGQDDVLEVVTAASQGSTRPGNVLLVKAGNVDTDCGAIEVRGALAEGQSHYGRFYFKRINRTATGSQHNFQYNFLGDIQQIIFNPNALDADAWRFNVDSPRGNVYPLNRWTCQTAVATDPLNPPWVRFNYDEWYRYEWRIEYRSGATRVRFFIRIYNSAGTLVADTNNLYRIDNPGTSTLTLQQWYDASATNEFTIENITEFSWFGLGWEGRPVGITSTPVYAVADFALAADDWIGDTVL